MRTTLLHVSIQSGKLTLAILFTFVLDQANQWNGGGDIYKFFFVKNGFLINLLTCGYN